ncbi:MarR family winged helix-turn-helix transcriptional regulator [Streptomyces sp. NPDC090445]|uniref:MarR family winged helix-turn-helix transcriptional regulator n=1 Tax=Streptomyces sp. NPDC090445 TaxID=3365963 RepID=UPI00382E54C1
MTPPRPPSSADEAHVARLQEEVSFALYVAARALARHYRPLLTELGLTYPQYLVMLVLWTRGPLTVKELGETLGLDSGTLSPLLQRLADKGTVDRRRSGGDGRQVLVASTRGGDCLRDRVRVGWEAAGGTPGDSAEQYEVLVDCLLSLTGRLRGGALSG